MSIDTSSIENPAGYRDVAPTVALKHLPEVRIIDVREVHEYNGPLGHIDGSELVPLGTIGAVALPWDRSAPILMVCRSGGRSGQACRALAQLGFSRLYNLSGGMMGWNDAQLPIERA
jgi:rhodanese-related sulfurtransferase